MEGEEKKYITLYEASKLCEYSQEYLSLRARQGKLTSVKIGRNWMTTEEWVEEYVGRVESYKVIKLSSAENAVSHESQIMNYGSETPEFRIKNQKLKEESQDLESKKFDKLKIENLWNKFPKHKHNLIIAQLLSAFAFILLAVSPIYAKYQNQIKDKISGFSDNFASNLQIISYISSPIYDQYQNQIDNVIKTNIADNAEIVSYVMSFFSIKLDDSAIYLLKGHALGEQMLVFYGHSTASAYSSLKQAVAFIHGLDAKNEALKNNYKSFVGRYASKISNQIYSASFSSQLGDYKSSAVSYGSKVMNYAARRALRAKNYFINLKDIALDWLVRKDTVIVKETTIEKQVVKNNFQFPIPNSQNIPTNYPPKREVGETNRITNEKSEINKLENCELIENCKLKIENFETLLASTKADFESKILTSQNYLFNELSSRYMSVPSYGPSLSIDNLDDVIITNGLKISSGQLWIASNEQIRQTGTGSVQFSGALTANKGAAVNGGNFTVNTDKFIIDYSTGNTTIVGTATISGAATFSGTTTLASMVSSGPLTITSAQNSYITGGGYLGVGTTTPSAYISIQDGSAAAPKFIIGSSTGTALVVDANGNLGLGTTSPSTKLSVFGDLFIEGTNRYVNFATTTGSNGYGLRDSSGTVQVRDMGGTWRSIPDVVTTSGGWTDDGTIVRLSTITDSVGIGTTTPVSLLQLANDTAPKLTISDTNANTNQKHWFIESDSGSFNVGTTSDALVANTSYRALTINSNGNVGIGTTSPSQLFSVNGHSYLTGGLGVGVSTTTNGVIQTSGNIYTSGNLFVGGQATSTTLYVSSKVGIGTSSPYGLLSVDSSNDITIPTLVLKQGSNQLTNLFENRNSIGESLLVLNSYGAITQNVGSTTLSIYGVISDATNLDSVYNVYVSGKYAYISSANPANRLTIIELGTSTPKVISSIQDNTNLRDAYGITVAGRYAYITSNFSDRLTIIDISNPNNPAIVGSIADATNLDGAWNVAVFGRYAYVTANLGHKLTAIDISDPYNPSVASVLTDATNLNSSRGLFISGRYAYVTSYLNKRLTLVDIANPLNMSLASSLVDATNMNNPQSVYVSGKYAYVASVTGDSLAIINIANPASIVLVSVLSDNVNLDGAYGVYVSGNYAYVTATNSNRLTAINISNQSSPSVSAVLYDNTNLNAPRGIYVAGHYAYIANTSGDSLTIANLGGFDIPTASIGNLEANYLSVTDNADFANNLYVRNGLNVGPGGIYSDGTTSAPYILASNRMGVGTSSPMAWFGVNEGAGLPSLLIGSSTATWFSVDEQGIFSAKKGVFFTGITSAVAGQYAVCINPTTGEITNGGAGVCPVSSIKYKENIDDLTLGIKDLMNLKPVTYNYKGNTTSTHIGLIAEDVQTVDSRLVDMEADGLSPRTIRWFDLEALIIKSIQEQQVEIEDLKAALNGYSIDENGILTAEKIKTKKLEMEDSATGELYCVTIENGEWVKVIGECSE